MKSIPGGTITFLFSDIEKSTRKWEESPHEMNIILQQHDKILKTVFEEYGGYIFKTVGDEFCVAFADPLDALLAGVESQKQLLGLKYGELTLNVRMGIHTGTATERDGDYFGPTLNRTARLMSAGHGGQILLSYISEMLVHDLLPESIELKCLGEQYLKDILSCEKVYQVVTSGLRADFPRLMTESIIHNNLPKQLTHFIGRQKDLKKIHEILSNTRLLTILGPGGVGKTRLSIELASGLREEYFDGIWFIDLSNLTDFDDIYKKIAEVLQLSDEASIPVEQNVIHFLKEKNLLLLFDNCEHLIYKSAEVIYNILMNCSDVKIISTSREPLNIHGEVTYRLPSLDQPPVEIKDPDKLGEYEAAKLFIDRALNINPDFKITNKTAPMLVQICSWLDGLPLSLELAAEKIRMFSLEEIVARLIDRFRLLKSEHQFQNPRQKTLLGLIEWSYNLLSSEEQLLLMKLAIFPDKWDCKTAEIICDDSISLDLQVRSKLFDYLNDSSSFLLEEASRYDFGDLDVVSILSSLVNKSLVIMESESGFTSYRMLVSIHEYAKKRLKESGHEEGVKERFIKYHVLEAEKRELEVIVTCNEEYLGKITEMYSSFILALDWSIKEQRFREYGKRLVSALYTYWKTLGKYREGLSWGVRFLELSQDITSKEVMWKLLWGTSIFATHNYDYTLVNKLLERQFVLCKELDNEVLYTLSLRAKEFCQYFTESYEEMFQLLESILVVLERHNLYWWINTVKLNKGITAYDMGNREEGRRLLNENVSQAKKLGQNHVVACSLLNLAGWDLHEGNYTKAIKLYHETLELYNKIGNRMFKIMILLCLGRIYRVMGDFDSAEEVLFRAFTISDELGYNIGIERANILTALVKIQQGSPEIGKSFLKRAIEVHETRDMQNSDAVILYAIIEILDLMGYKSEAVRNLQVISSLLDKWVVDFTPYEWENIERLKGEGIDGAPLNCSYEDVFLSLLLISNP